MGCQTCGAPAPIGLRRYGLALYATHLPPWLVKQTEHIIHRYRMFSYSDCVLVAVSGGEDSLVLWE